MFNQPSPLPINFVQMHRILKCLNLFTIALPNFFNCFNVSSTYHDSFLYLSFAHNVADEQQGGYQHGRETHAHSHVEGILVVKIVHAVGAPQNTKSYHHHNLKEWEVKKRDDARPKSVR